jgi:hypothetical protein
MEEHDLTKAVDELRRQARSCVTVSPCWQREQ